MPAMELRLVQMQPVESSMDLAVGCQLGYAELSG